MKLSRSSVLRLVGLLALVLVLGGGATAFGAASTWSGGVIGTTLTNPNLPPVEWRQGWGNSLEPQFTWNTVPSDGITETTGLLYTFTRTPSDVPTEAYKEGISWDRSGVMLGHTFNLYGIELDKNPSVQPKALEGRWYFNMRFFSPLSIDPRSVHYELGVDVTKPERVEGFTTGVTMPTHSSRRTVTWTNKQYDALSGVAWYHLFLNGNEFKKFSVDKDFPWWLPAPSLTLEDLPPGVNKLSIVAEDRATNLSDPAEITAIVDPGYPTLEVGFPSEGALVRGTVSFDASATDDACSPIMTFKIDGDVKSRIATSPAKFDFDTTRLADGKHTLLVETTDLFGHARSVSRTFYVDNRKIRVTSVSDSPDPFYPVKRDGYKDSMTVHAYLDEPATDVFLYITPNVDTSATGGTESKDAVVVIKLNHYTMVGRGWNSFSWDGTDEGGNALLTPGAPAWKQFKYQLAAKDAAGNWTFSSFGTTEMRNFEIIPVGQGKVKVVDR